MLDVRHFVRHAQAFAHAHHRAGQHDVCAELAPCLLGVVGDGGVGGGAYHLHRGEAGQARGERFGEAVDDELSVRLAGEVFERYGDVLLRQLYR